MLDALKGIAAGRLYTARCDGPVNFSGRINTGVLAAKGEHVLLLNDDIDVVTPDWLERMVIYSQIPQVGAVGAKLLFGDGCLQHAGVNLDEVGPAISTARSTATTAATSTC